MSTENSPHYAGIVPGFENVATEMQATFRRGRPSDAEQAAKLVYAAGPAEFRYVFSITHESQALEFLTWAWAQGGQFGYDEHLVIDVNGQAIATGIARTSACSRRLFFKSIKQIFTYFPLSQAIKVSWRGIRAEHNVPPARKGQRYIADIAVDPAFRGQGLAHALVSKLLTFFPEQDLVSTLHVNTQNDSARRVYLRLGFEDAGYCHSTLKSDHGQLGDHWLMQIKAENRRN